MIKNKTLRNISALSFLFSITFSLGVDKFEGKRFSVFVFIFLAGIPTGYVVSWLLQALNWVAFSDKEGDGLGLLPFLLKILSIPFLPIIWITRVIRRRKESRRYELARPERERAEAEAHDRAFWSSPEGQKVRAAQLLAEAEKSKAEALAQIRLAETSGLAGIARGVAQEEEERQRRQLEELRSL